MWEHAPRLNNVLYVAVARTTCQVETKRARPFIVPSSEPQQGLTLIEPLRPYFPCGKRRNRRSRRNLSIPSTSRTTAAMRGTPSMNLLAGLDAPIACAPSRQTPSPRNSWRSRHTGLGAQSPPGPLTRSCANYERSQNPRETVSLALSGQGSLLLFSGAWSQKSLRVWILSSPSSYSTPRRLSNLGFAISSLPPRFNSKFRRSGEEH